MFSRFIEIPTDPIVVLVRPKINRWKLYKWYAPLGSREPSLGLLYIASYIFQNGYNVHIVDGESVIKSEFIKKIIVLKPDVIGITSTTFSFGNASKLAGQLRSQLPNSLILLGGSHATALAKDTLLRVPSLDGVIVGEGEETMLEIIRKRDTNTIDGLVWRKEPESEIHTNKLRKVVTDLDKYSINWKLLEGFPERYTPPYQSKKGNSVGLVVSRGCFYDCSFCSASRFFGRKIRFHSSEYVIKLMSELENEYGINDFYFHDDYFPAYPKWMEQFCSALIEREKRYSWSCASRIDNLNNEILSLMKKSGCRQIGIGVESGSQKVLDRIVKKISVTSLQRGLNRISSSGINLKGYFILDTPSESFSDLFKTLRLIIKLNFSHVQFNYYAPLPGSGDYKRNKVPEKLWNKMSLQKCLGYSNINRLLYPFIEVSFYLISYIIIFINRVRSEVLNPRTKLSS